MVRSSEMLSPHTYITLLSSRLVGFPESDNGQWLPHRLSLGDHCTSLERRFRSVVSQMWVSGRGELEGGMCNGGVL